MKLSVIIPTYNRRKDLLNALHSLQEQKAGSFEIIVVDNANDPAVLADIELFNSKARLPVRYIPEPEIGLNHARHAGVRSAVGEVLVFTDDDATFEPDWLLAYEKAFTNHPDMIAAGGPIKPAWEINPPEWLIKYIGDRKIFPIFSLMDSGTDLSVSNDGIFFGVNMAIRKSVFEWTGFRPELYGTRTIGDGESGLNEELRNKGHMIGYIPDAGVNHHIPAFRMSLAYIRRWAWHLGGAQMYRRWFGRNRNLITLTKEFFIITSQYLSSWVHGLFVMGLKDPESINKQFNASLGWCKINYLFWIIKDKKVRDALDMTRFSP